MNVQRFLAAVALGASLPMTAAAQTSPPAATGPSTRAIAQEAYVYGFPAVDLYRIMYGYFVDPKSPAFKAPFNKLYNSANVYTPADTTIQTPNSDTPYSFVGLDLRAQPIVLTLPPIQKKRYYSAQFVDQYTFNIAYAGSRTTGNRGGNLLLAGPGWKGTVPAGITKVIRFDTGFGLALIRTQLFGPADLANVKKIQAGYKAQTLSSFAQTAAPAATPPVKWPAPLAPADERTSPKFFGLLAFILQFCPADPSEVALRARFAGAGIVPGQPFDPGTQSAAYVAGMGAGQAEIDAKRKTVRSANDLFGTRAAMKNDFLLRAVAAQYGILGNTAAEAVYLGYTSDASGQPLTGAKKYAFHFAKGQLPPVNAFWSVTMYNLPKQLLVANPIDRYLINSPMLPTMKRDPDGGLTIYVQQATPGGAKAANWLPAPPGSFLIITRLYWPKESVLNGTWKEPPMTVSP